MEGDEKMKQDLVNPLQDGLFQTFYLVNNERQDVEVIEGLAIDFEEILACLKLGGSIFITSKQVEEQNPDG
jgi:hypothetical protein